jgi:hypothetical protein
MVTTRRNNKSTKKPRFLTQYTFFTDMVLITWMCLIVLWTALCPTVVRGGSIISDEAVSTPIQLTFKQLQPPSTYGRLTVKYNDVILLSELLDISSEIQRRYNYAKAGFECK